LPAFLASNFSLIVMGIDVSLPHFRRRSLRLR
jgi:hypothetical protein